MKLDPDLAFHFEYPSGSRSNPIQGFYDEKFLKFTAKNSLIFFLIIGTIQCHYGTGNLSSAYRRASFGAKAKSAYFIDFHCNILLHIVILVR